MPTLTDDYLEAPQTRFVTFRDIMITLAGLVLVVLTLLLGRASAMVVLVTASNDTLPFPDLEAGFAPDVPVAGISGNFYATYPLDACNPIINGPSGDEVPTFALIERGNCKFDTKVFYAQKAGFDAAIIFNNEDSHELILMSGNAAGIHIPAVFVSKSAGEALIAYSQQLGAKCFILPAIENTAWSVMAVSFISLLAVTAVLTTFLFVRRYRLRHLGSRILSLRDSLGMSSREVKALPTIIFKCVGEHGNSETCAICLEDYESGEKLRVLPCHHDFHAHCVDLWLTTRRPFCPVCKRDAHNKNEVPPPSESTPLLSPGTISPVAVPSIPAATQTSPVNSLRNSQSGYSSTFSSPVGSPQMQQTATVSATNNPPTTTTTSLLPSTDALVFHSAPGRNAFLHKEARSSSSASNPENDDGLRGDDMC